MEAEFRVRTVTVTVTVTVAGEPGHLTPSPDSLLWAEDSESQEERPACHRKWPGESVPHARGPLPDTRLRGKMMESALGVLYGLWAVSVRARKNLLLWGLGLCHVSLGVVRENGAFSGPEAVRRPGTWALGISEAWRERPEDATCRAGSRRRPRQPAEGAAVTPGSGQAGPRPGLARVLLGRGQRSAAWPAAGALGARL